ncbi:MAG: hypothetical protein DBX52_05940 [Clostridiales bacterium]|nr:MAG: hypothetical protein DBX52_05940 [Clostridiales bacterium]
MKKSGIALCLVICLLFSGCAGKTEEKAEAGYTAPKVVQDDGVITSGKIDVSDENKQKVQTKEGDILVVEDYSKDFIAVTAENTFTVFDLNLSVENGEGDRSYAERFKALMKLLVQANPDIMTFQEVGANWMDYIVTMLKDIYDYYLIYPDSADKTIANPIFFKKEKFKDLTGGCFWLSDTPDQESAVSSGAGKYNCMWMQLEDRKSGNAVYVFNAQLGGNEQEIQKGAAVIKEKCESIGWSKPIVCNLDLGLTKESQAAQTLLEKFADANDKNNQTATSHQYTGKGSVCDFSFYTKMTLRADSYSVITDRPTGIFVSDHSPLLIQYTLNTEALDYSGEFIF